MSVIKKILLLVIIFSFLLGYSTLKKEKLTEQAYNPEQYELIYTDEHSNRFYTTSLDELEERVKTLDSGVIVVVERVGDTSINRIIEPLPGELEPGKTYGVSHVLTPIKLVKIIYKKEEVNIVEAEQYYLKEPFFFITEETPQYLDEYGKGTILSREYEPIKSTQQYILFGLYESSETYDYNGETIFGTLGLREAVYPLKEKLIQKAAVNDYAFSKLYDQVLDKYGSLDWEK